MFQFLQNINFSPESTNVFGIFLVIGALLCLFGVWYEGKKDGFDDEKLFDLFLVSFFGALIMGKITYFLLNPIGIKKFSDVVSFVFSGKISFEATILVFLYIAIAMARKWKWSPFRVLDICSLGLSFLASIASLGYVVYTQQPKFLFIFTLYILFYSIFSTLRNHKVKSGLSFVFFCLATTAILYSIFGISYLPIYLLLITIGALVIYFRFGKNMSTHLSGDFIEKMKHLLLAKDKELAKQEEYLKANDPYLTYEDRENDNAEVVEDATEDMMHETQQMELGIVQKSREQVKKALTKLHLGTYGVSDVSGKPIPQERLEAYPEATTLVGEEVAPSEDQA
jgi:DnaK suppressor protein